MSSTACAACQLSTSDELLSECSGCDRPLCWECQENGCCDQRPARVRCSSCAGVGVVFEQSWCSECRGAGVCPALQREEGRYAVGSELCHQCDGAGSFDATVCPDCHGDGTRRLS